ncbi:MAG: hypothetical protein ACHQ2Y_10345 [Candidatus Lutacidiplasmatales archaeon]
MTEYAIEPTAGCRLCDRYGSLNHDRHRKYGRGLGLGPFHRKRCVRCRRFMPNRSRSALCEVHLQEERLYSKREFHEEARRKARTERFIRDMRAKGKSLD